uniref:BLTX418 n=1 Tax=Nephila pilipes TaxID=299642 RepID=A0A076KZJ0_NEPPI|nr:BLTX418 [Nephila pilipes]
MAQSKKCCCRSKECT